MRRATAAVLVLAALWFGYILGQLKQNEATQQWRKATHALARSGMRHYITFHPEHTDMVEYYYEIAKAANPGEKDYR